MEFEFTREQVEEAMDAYDRYLQGGEYREIFGRFGRPVSYWVRSTRNRPCVYPSKPIIGWLFRETKRQIRDGWFAKPFSAAVPHNVGFIIVNDRDLPAEVPVENYPHLIRGLPRIRLCARNYFIEPARENELESVTIRAGELAREMGLEDTPRNIRNICKALESREFQEMAGVPEPKTAGPSPSEEAEFHFELVGKPGGRRPGKFALREFRRRTKGMPRRTEAQRLRVERVGQDVFRSALVVHWRGRCPLTGISDRRLLRASHIIPWSKCKSDAERLDVNNGLLLSALWDAAFDRGLVSFGDDGEPLFSPDLGKEELSALCWQKPTPLTAGHRAKLAWHRGHHGFKPGR